MSKSGDYMPLLPATFDVGVTSTEPALASTISGDKYCLIVDERTINLVERGDEMCYSLYTWNVKDITNVIYVKKKSVKFETQFDDDSGTYVLKSKDAPAINRLVNSLMVSAKKTPADDGYERISMVPGRKTPDPCFEVNIVSTEASLRCHVVGKHMLHVSQSDISISKPGEKTALYSWPLPFIRRVNYYIQENYFGMEAGRRCSTGEGLFLFATPKWEDLYKTVTERIYSLKKS